MSKARFAAGRFVVGKTGCPITQAFHLPIGHGMIELSDEDMADRVGHSIHTIEQVYEEFDSYFTHPTLTAIVTFSEAQSALQCCEVKFRRDHNNWRAPSGVRSTHHNNWRALKLVHEIQTRLGMKRAPRGSE
jgi:hypothetical protein